MNPLRKFLNQVLHVLAGGSFLAMTILTCWQVLTRYVLKNPSSWSEELVSYLFAWMALLGASLVAGERGHMNIPLLMDRMGPAARKSLAVFSEIVACLFAGIILVIWMPPNTRKNRNLRRGEGDLERCDLYALHCGK